MSVLAKNLAEAKAANGEIRAGGTDYSARLRTGIADAEVVDISRIPNLDKIANGPNGISIGTLVTIDEVANDSGIRKHYPGLSMAAGALATAQIRRAASMGGSLLQRTRCWYYRNEDFDCYKKGGNSCPARNGNHHYGVCFDLGPCVFPHPSTLGLMLMIYNASVELNSGNRIPVDVVFGDGRFPQHDHTLSKGEILTQIHLPPPLSEEKAAYFRAITRARAEWPLVEAGVRYQLDGGKMRNVSVGIGGVANVPLLLKDVSAFLEGKSPSQENFAEAGRMAIKKANPLPGTQYKLDLVTGTVFETLRRADAGIWGGEG